ncbi:hypothetical protein OHA70_25525 [Kribbella sp. NBC_00382]|uniref:hypothetical protein n=1 Tax=Kribbella sp. NBC_00382 TaxID=2975967 RepID=UPI002E22A5A2
MARRQRGAAPPPTGQPPARRPLLSGHSTAGFDREKVPDQDVTNEHWPPPAVARTLQPFPSDYRIDVDARLVWEVDGEEWVEATAIAWTQHHVKLFCQDPRLLVPYVWLAPADVRRRPLADDAPAIG